MQSVGRMQLAVSEKLRRNKVMGTFALEGASFSSKPSGPSSNALSFAQPAKRDWKR